MISRKNGTVVDAQVSSRHSRLSLSDVEPLEATCRVQKCDCIRGKKKREKHAVVFLDLDGTVLVSLPRLSSSSEKIACLLLFPVQF